MSHIGAASNRRFRGLFYGPIHRRFFLLLSLILGAVLFLLYLNVVGTAFHTLFPGLGAYGILLILATCLLGSYVNIPLKRYRSLHPRLTVRRVTVFGISYPVPAYRVGYSNSIVAIIVGGAVVPIASSLYLLAKAGPALPSIVAGVAIIAAVVKVVARPVRGVGIVVPVLIPPVAAALVGMLLGGEFSYAVTYVAGTLGTLIGADLLNLKVILKLGAPITSIGGAGTFDGVFLAGIMGVLIAA